MRRGRCSQLRPRLPQYKLDHNVIEWTMRQVEELCKCETDKDSVNVAKDAIQEASNRQSSRHSTFQPYRPVELPKRSHEASDGGHVHQQTSGTAIVGSARESLRVMDLATVADASVLTCSLGLPRKKAVHLGTPASTVYGTFHRLEHCKNTVKHWLFSDCDIT